MAAAGKQASEQEQDNNNESAAPSTTIMPHDTIGMRLRNVVRSPQRLEQDASYNPMPKKKKSKSKSKASPVEEKSPRPRFIDFNPNLPPAAFPTLDAPRPPTHHAHGDGDPSGRNRTEDNAVAGDRQGSMLENLDRLSLLTNPDGHSGRSLSPARDIPMDDLDNVMASNGDLNRTWMSNMSRMAAAANDKDSGLGTEMEDSDSDSPSIQPDPSTEYLNPAWTDLSERMQAEIFDNLLQSYTYPAVCQMLGLMPDELNAMVTTLESRNKQIELEDTSLEAMRAKQFRELARVDNSPRVQSQSHQLAFRKASRQTFRGLRGTIDPKVDFFACEGSEHTAAKVFLRRREIEATHAGSWGNDVANVHMPEEEEEEDEVPFTSFGLDGGPGPSPNPISGFDSKSATDSKPMSPSSPPFEFQEAFINWLGRGSGSIDTLDHHQRYGKSTLHPRWLTLLNEKTMKPEAELAAREQLQQFDLVRCEDKLSAPPLDVLYDEPLEFLDSEELERRYSVHMRQAQQQRQQRQRQFAGIIRRPIINSYSGPLLGPASYRPSTPQRRSKVVRLRYSPRGRSAAAASLSTSRSSSQRPRHRSQSRSRPRPRSIALPERPSMSTSTPRQIQSPRAALLEMQAQRQIHSIYAGQSAVAPVTNTSIQSNANGDTNGNCQTPNPGPSLAGLVKSHAFIPLSPSASSSYQPSSTQQSDTELDTEVEEEPLDDDEDELVLVPTPLK